MKTQSISNLKNTQRNHITNKNYIAFKQIGESNLAKDEFVTSTDVDPKSPNLKRIGFAVGAVAVAYGVYKFGIGKLRRTGQDCIVAPVIDYIQNLATDMSKALNKKIEPEQLSAVMTPKELLEALPKLKKENYFAYRQDILPNVGYKKIFDMGNLENGIFKVDLHSHTHYSDGQATVAALLNDVAEYADKLNAKTNEKFIFSITDHDGIGGVKEALKLIAQDPNKFKNLKFVPGVELSYAHLGKNNQITCSELLAHCINPYSPELNAFIDKTLQGRKNLFTTVIDELNKANIGVKFDINEIEGNFFRVKDDHDWFRHSIHWRLHNYLHVKQRLSKLAEKWGKNPESIYQEIMPQWHIGSAQKSPHSFEEFLIQRNVDMNGTSKLNDTISKICSEHFPSLKNGEIVATSERTFDDVVNFFQNDKNVILSFAHPAFTAQKLDNPQAFFKSLIDKSKGLIKGTERHHMSYFLPIKNGSTTQEMVDNTNKMMDGFNLFNVGGHDNHGYKLLS